jgi:hypothetical protein
MKFARLGRSRSTIRRTDGRRTGSRYWYGTMHQRRDSIHMDAATGKRTPLSEVKLLDRAGDVNVAVCHATPDGKFHICSEHRLLTDLFVANGLR